MAKAVQMTQEELRTMQLLELDMLVEFDRVCRKHNIGYCIAFGTLLGAVRHKGFIPWDDDADIIMLREEYEKFKLVEDEMDHEICYFQDHSNDPEYLWGYGKLRRTGTSFVRLGQEHMKGKTGLFIDIFPQDDIPLNIPGMMLQNFYCFCLRKILWSRVGKVSEKGFMKAWYGLISHIPVGWVYARVNKMTVKSRNNTPNRVRTLLFPPHGRLYPKPLAIKYGMPKEWFLEREEYEFEGHRFFGVKDYDAYLKYLYNDYMTLPPEEKRRQNSPVSSFDFNVRSKSIEER